MDAILHAVANTCEDYPGGVTGMAAAIGKNKFSLMHEIACAGTAKLGLIDAAKIAVRARDPRIPNAFAEACGGLFLPGATMIEADGTTLAELAVLAKDFARLVEEISASAADARISDNERARIERAGSDMLVAYQVLMAHLRAENENPKHRHLRAA